MIVTNLFIKYLIRTLEIRVIEKKQVHCHEENKHIKEIVDFMIEELICLSRSKFKTTVSSSFIMHFHL